MNCRIILIRHGQPHIALSPRTSHKGFADYIGAYEEAGLSPAELQVIQSLGAAVIPVSAELGGGLEYPHYTRPADFRGWRVPDVLLSGDHAKIEGWRREHVR